MDWNLYISFLIFDLFDSHALIFFKIKDHIILQSFDNILFRITILNSEQDDSVDFQTHIGKIHRDEVFNFES